jgi:hypothetical protein
LLFELADTVPTEQDCTGTLLVVNGVGQVVAT